MIVAELVQGIFGGVEQIIQMHKINNWITLLITMLISFWCSSAFTCGTALLAHRSWAESVGAGLVSGSVMAVVVFRRSPLSRGMIVALPSAEAGLRFIRTRK